MDWSFVLLILVILSLSMYVVNRDKIKKLERSTKIENIEMKIRISYNEIKNMNTLFQIIIISCIIAISTVILILLNDFFSYSNSIIILPFILIILDIFNINRNKDKNESRTFETETELKTCEQLEDENKYESLEKFPLKYLKLFMVKNPTRIYSIFGIFIGMILLIASTIFIMEWFEVVDDTQKEYCESYGIYYDSEGSLIAHKITPNQVPLWTINYCEDVHGSFIENPNLRNLREYLHSPLNSDEDFGFHYDHENGFWVLDYTFWGHWNNDELGPNQYHYWAIYLISTVAMILGILKGEIKRTNLLEAIKKHKDEKISMLTKLAKDPKGVIEGRIDYPNEVEPIIPSKRNLQFAAILCIFITIVTLMSISSIINGLHNMRLAEGSVTDDIFFVTLVHGIQLSSTQVLFLSSMHLLLGTYKDEYDVEEVSPLALKDRNSNINEEESEEEEELIKDKQKHRGPISFEHVLKALGNELETARAESSALRFELDMTKDKVQSLEIEVDEKNKELEDIQNLQQNMIIIAEEDKKKEKGEGKSLSLMDSVLSGDVLFDSSKIDQQIINDPEAIAKAAINAYRQGKNDSQE